MRLEELWDVVDHFVLVESSETFQGDSKPFYFEENSSLFEKYMSKIIHVKIEDRHPELLTWPRQHFQRRSIANGLAHCDSFDVIIISDVDEIPRRTVFPEILETFFSQENIHSTTGVTLVQPLYRYQLNRYELEWQGPLFTTYPFVESLGADNLRRMRDSFPLVNNAGWHFTSIGDEKFFRDKMLSISDIRAKAQAEFSDEEIRQLVISNPAIAINESFPEYVIKNMDYLKSLGYIAPLDE